MPSIVVALPPPVLNLIPVIALVVFPYPAINAFSAKAPFALVETLQIKCLTKTVDDGLKNKSSPQILASASPDPPSCASPKT